MKLDSMFILNKILFIRFIFSLKINIQTYQRTLKKSAINAIFLHFLNWINYFNLLKCNNFSLFNKYVKFKINKIKTINRDARLFNLTVFTYVYKTIKITLQVLKWNV